MKLFKRILLGLVILIVLGGTMSFFYFKNKFLSAPPNELSVTNLGQPFDFKWEGYTYNGKHNPYGAMLIPVSIPGVDRTFYMQFDTGTPSTVLKYNPFLSINEKYNNLIKIDTIEGKLRAIEASIKVGTVDVAASSLGFVSMGKKIDWSDSTAVDIIGSIGNDFMEKNPLIIDFKSNKITLLDSLPQKSDVETDYLPITFDGRKIFLSATLNKKPASLWYDSGSSMFELIVEESTFWKLAVPNAKKESFEIPSWGRKVPAHNIESNGEFQFGAVKIPLKTVTYMEWPNKMQAFVLKAANIGGDLGGMTGNKLFLEKTLILDAPNLRYTVKE
ncbi:hypothetical protein [Algoriphagus limi]|uniref:Aspartyl protease n=1 Tax=Algoriphagus limi TaxID=2975273 RepID=A0ABT2GBL5_9BACT|nr:hypothetical protein [Algoriphagus limi]MCS5491796.1 hypothetical protein [Algoriphagus limi]